MGRSLAVRLVLGVTATLVVALFLTMTGGGHRRATHGAHRKTSSESAPVAFTAPVPPATMVPEATPVQKEYDRGLADGLAATGAGDAVAAAEVPAAAVSAQWPELPPTEDSASWSRTFVQELLSIDFAHQPRDGLAAWLSAEEAPELLPGVPAAAAHKMLYLSLFEPELVGAELSPIPSDEEWANNARDGVVWSVSDVVVQPDPRFARLLTDGWRPTDQRFAAQDVSGALTVTRGQATVVKPFSMVVYTGSAHWHQGYGTVLIGQWKEASA